MLRIVVVRTVFLTAAALGLGASPAFSNSEPPLGAEVSSYASDFSVWTSVDQGASPNGLQSPQFAIKPAGGFWRVYSERGPVLPGDASSGPSGYVSVEDLGVQEPEGPPAPEIIETYRMPDGSARVAVHHAYWSPLKGLQCSATATFTFGGGTVVRFADADGVRRNFTGTGTQMAAALGATPFVGEFTGYRVPPGTPAAQTVPESGISADVVAANPALRAAVAANAERLRSIAAAPDVAGRQARFAAWFADQQLLGQGQQADAALAAQADALALYDTPKFAALLHTLRENWAGGQNPKTFASYATGDFDDHYTGAVSLRLVSVSRGSFRFTASRVAKVTLRTQTWKPARNGHAGRWSAGRIQQAAVPLADAAVEVRPARRLARGRYRFTLTDAQGRGGQLVVTRRLR